VILKVLRRIGITLLVTVVFVLVSVYATLYHIANGPSPTVRNILVQAAEQASATKWLPGLFLDAELVAEIVNAGMETESLMISDILPIQPSPDQSVTIVASATEGSLDASPDVSAEPPYDPWDEEGDGMKLVTYLGDTFKAYVLLVRDPSRVYTAISNKGFSEDKRGVTAAELMKYEPLAAAINGGGFYDPDGVGKGGMPIGLVYSGGECVWDDGEDLTFVGMDKDNNLVAMNSLTREEADALNIRDGCCFLRNNVLISSKDGEVTAHYSNWSTSMSQRAAIGQTEDGTIILMVTEGRSATYLGAKRNDVINAMLSFGAVTAAMLDGGSSTVMLYPGFHEKYGIDEATLSATQKQGIVFIGQPSGRARSIPTYFAVAQIDDAVMKDGNVG
jgi:exopolysaccharide biosynthesis protein